MDLDNLENIQPWGRYGSVATVVVTSILVGLLLIHSPAGFFLIVVPGIGVYVLVGRGTSWWDKDAIAGLTKFQRFLIVVFAEAWLFVLIVPLILLILALITGGMAAGEAVKAEVNDIHRRADEASIRSAVEQGIYDATRDL